MSRSRKPRARRGQRSPQVPPPSVPPAPPPDAPTDLPKAARAHRWPRGSERRLRDNLEQFAAEVLGEDGVLRALQVYGDETGLEDDTAVEGKAEMSGFLEWLINDHETLQGRRLIERYPEERAPQVGAAEQEMLALWRTENYLRLLEVQAVRPGEGVVVEDLLSGETLQVDDHNTARSVLRWELLLARVQTGERRFTFTGPVMCLQPRHKKALLATLVERWDGHRARQPDDTLAEFSRCHALDIIGQVRARQVIDDQPPVLVTEEGHPVVEATAEFDIRDGKSAAARLHEAQEFQYQGPSEAHSGALSFDWLTRGRTVLPPKGDIPDGAMMLRSELRGSLGSRLDVVGNVWVWTDHLRLQCLSRERLVAGRQLLESLLGPDLQHREDRCEPLTAPIAPSPPPRRGVLSRRPRGVGGGRTSA